MEISFNGVELYASLVSDVDLASGEVLCGRETVEDVVDLWEDLDLENNFV